MCYSYTSSIQGHIGDRKTSRLGSYVEYCVSIEPRIGNNQWTILNIDINPNGSASAKTLPATDGEVAVSTTLTNQVVVGDAPFDAEDVAIDAREGEEFTESLPALAIATR